MTPLHSLLSEQGELRRAYHGREPVLLRQAVSTEGLPTSAEIDALIDASLLRWPYLTLFQDGVRAPLSEVTTSRRIRGQQVDGFLNPDGVRRHLAAGATLRMSEVQHWNPTTRRQVEELATTFPTDVTSLMFLTPEGKRGLLPHRDGSRTIVVQLEGAKEWHLYWSEDGDTPDPTLDVDPASEVDSFVLRPGDVLFMPYAYGHAASAVGETSLHITFLMAEPSPDELLGALVAEWLGTERMSALLRQHSTLSLPETVETVLAELEKFAHEVDTDGVLARALTTINTRDGS
ncbi:JmjC domain-containing protein [Actinophytocola xanthii]|uniref:JmjC domain-containing protein n=1 Tax=Actinophytocola xanthii TaxID=1912961 RepID=A0A1Q8CA90_9PSEU|nr:cupin domain-containing protein [Actinophytocola xanthii]OLF11291.1 hypothetical protein BU204_30685 [Actinophytocola xanthii]